MLKKMMLMMGCLFVSGFAFSEPQDKWIAVTGTKDVMTFVNPSRIKIFDNNNQIVEFWGKTTYIKNKFSNGILFNVDDFYISKDKIDCINHKVRNTTTILYRRNIDPLTVNMERDQWNDIVPDTMNEIVEKKVCSLAFPNKDSKRRSQ